VIPAFIDRFLLDTPGFVSRRYRGYKWWRWGERELHLVPALCDRWKCSVDVGAHCGMYTYFMGRTSLHCLAFEPNPRLLGQLNSQAVNTTIYSCALSDHCFATELRIPREKGGLRLGCATIEPENRAKTETVNEPIEVRTLDSFHLTNVGFVKIDAEGHELAVLKGAAATLRTSHPRLLIEAEDRHRPNAVSSVVSFLEEMGYSGFFLSGRELQPISKFDTKVHQRPDAPVYIANFIFLHWTDTSALQGFRGSSLSRHRTV
jgi:FkbM family methyltransferase